MPPSRDLSGVPSRSTSAWSTNRWSSALSPITRGADLVEHGLHGLLHALAAVALAAVAQLDGLVLPGRRAGRHRRTGKCSVDQSYLDLDGRVASGIEDLAGPDLLDNRHWVLLA